MILVHSIFLLSGPIFDFVDRFHHQGCAMSDEQFERDDMTVVRGTNKAETLFYPQWVDIRESLL